MQEGARITSGLVPLSGYAPLRQIESAERMAARASRLAAEQPPAPPPRETYVIEIVRDAGRMRQLRQDWEQAHRSRVVAAYSASADARSGTLFDLAA